MPAVATYGRRSLVELAIESLPESRSRTRTHVRTHTPRLRIFLYGSSSSIQREGGGGGGREAGVVSSWQEEQFRVDGNARFVPHASREASIVDPNRNQFRLDPDPDDLVADWNLDTRNERGACTHARTWASLKYPRDNAAGRAD